MAVREKTARGIAGSAGRGLLMGGADIIPGVSGGTVALVLGIYERLIGSIGALVSALVRAVRGDVPAARERAREVEWGLVLPLGAGIAVALAIGSILLPPLLERYPAPTSALFLGLVAGSLPIPWRRISSVAPRHLAAVAIAALLAFWLVGLPPRVASDPAAPHVFAAASVAISAMILPGVSGAFLLKAMGLYEVSLSALRHLDVGYLTAFLGGAAVGLAVFAKLLGWLLGRARDLTMAVLVGLMAGALRALWPWQTDDRGLLGPPAAAGEVAVVVALAVAGFLGVVALTAWGDRSHPGHGPTTSPLEPDARR